MHDGDAAFQTIPDSAELAAQYMLLMPAHAIEPLITYDASEVSLLVRHNVASSHELNAVVAQVSGIIEEHLNPHFDWRITGESILSITSADALVVGQAKSLISVLLVVFMLMALLFVNLKAGALSLIPNILPIVMLGGLMGVLGFKLDIGTSMVAVVAIGIAVDDTIHFMTRYYSTMRRLQDQNLAMEACIHEEIRPMVATSFGLAVGFGTLTLSSMVPLIQFGFLSALVMLFALVMDLIITPILLSSTQLLTLWDMLTLNVPQEVIQNSPLFRNMKRWHIKKVVLLGRMLTAKAGDALVQYGDHGCSMFLLLEGCVTIEVKDAQTGELLLIDSLNPGEVFGELSLIEPGPRTANVHAIGDTLCLELDRSYLERIRRIYPSIAAHLYRNLSQILGKRLKDTTQKLFV